MLWIDDFVVIGDSGLAIGPTFPSAVVSENSKFFTGSSALKIRYELPVFAGVLLNSRMGSIGKKLDNSLQHGQKGDGRVETSK